MFLCFSYHPFEQHQAVLHLFLEGLSQIRVFRKNGVRGTRVTLPLPPAADEILQRGHLPPPLRFYGVPTHVDSLKWAWQLKNIKSVCVFKNNLWLGIKKWLLNKNGTFFFFFCKCGLFFFFLLFFVFWFFFEDPTLAKSFRSCVCFTKHLASGRCRGNISTPSGISRSSWFHCTCVTTSPQGSQMFLFYFFTKFWMQ